ncbi:MAG: hypothetical protein R3261_02245 [Alphaproteobacteria bacterium]|nr:hypothetical protein [Alphaproteobacteria bacterium]
MSNTPETTGVSVNQLVVALERVELALKGNAEIQEDLKKIRTSIRSLEHLQHEGNAAMLGLAAITASILRNNPVSDAEIQQMLDQLTPPTDLGQLNRERANSLYTSIVNAAKEAKPA